MEYQGIEKLRGADNWNVWKFAVRNLLRGTENAYEVCIGEILKPNPLRADAAAQQQEQYREGLKMWDKADRAASQIIVKTLDTKVMALLVSCETARDMWLKLHTIYEQQTKQASHTVQSEFFNFNMDPSDDMVTHIAKFEGLILRMQQLNVKPDELSLTVKLLDTLPEEYESLRQAWWARAENQQTFSNLLEVLTSDDARRKIRVGKQEQMAALVASKSKRHDRGNTSGKKGQSQQSGESKLGEKGKSKLNYKCYNCGEKGHFRQNCPKKPKKTQDSNPKEEAFVCETMTAELENDSWIVDSGATDHVTNRSDLFTSFDYFKTPAKIHIGNKTTMDALGKGTIKIETLVDGKWSPGQMENVLFVPAARRNLFSVISVLDKGMEFNSSKNGCEFVKDGIVKARGVRVNQLFKMVIRVRTPEKACMGEVNLASKDSLHVWHERLGHQNKNHVKKFLVKNQIDFFDDNQFCGSCIEGKQHRNSFQLRQQRAESPGEVIHADLCGPMETTSLGRSK